MLFRSDAFTGSIFAVAGAQPVGRLLQQYLTTSADVGAMEIVGVRSYAPGVRKVLTRGAR